MFNPWVLQCSLLIYCRIKKELERLEKNKARRQAREQQKELHSKAHGQGDVASPGANTGGDKVATGTTRKCANCGQVGHIKTNKKYGQLSFPLLPPPPRVSFGWWHVPESDVQVDSNARRKRQHKTKQPALVEMIQQSERENRKAAAEQERLERQAAKDEEKLARQAAQEEQKQATEATKDATARRKEEEDRLDKERKRRAEAEGRGSCDT